MVRWFDELFHTPRQGISVKGQPVLDMADNPDDIDAQIIDCAYQYPDGAEQKEFTLYCFQKRQNPICQKRNPHCGRNHRRAHLVAIFIDR